MKRYECTISNITTEHNTLTIKGLGNTRIRKYGITIAPSTKKAIS